LRRFEASFALSQFMLRSASRFNFLLRLFYLVLKPLRQAFAVQPQ
jgi:hypothetical protein